MFDEKTTFILVKILEGVVEEGTGTGAKVLGIPVAGKTGTTNDFTDAWFVGYAPNLVTGTWVGFDDIRSLGRGEAGASAALPIWISYMGTALWHITPMEFPVPEEITYVKIDPYNGLLASPGMTDFTVEVFKKGTEPTLMSSAGSSAGGVRPPRVHEDEEPLD